MIRVVIVKMMNWRVCNGVKVKEIVSREASEMKRGRKLIPEIRRVDSCVVLVTVAV